jgi:hypothetical protein
MDAWLLIHCAGFTTVQNIHASSPTEYKCHWITTYARIHGMMHMLLTGFGGNYPALCQNI